MHFISSYHAKKFCHIFIVLKQLVKLCELNIMLGFGLCVLLVSFLFLQSITFSFME